MLPASLLPFTFFLLPSLECRMIAPPDGNILGQYDVTEVNRMRQTTTHGKEHRRKMNVTQLECAACGLAHEARRLQNLCTRCGKPLLVRYDLERAGKSLTKQ